MTDSSRLIATELYHSATQGTATVRYKDQNGIEKSLTSSEIAEWARIAASLPKSMLALSATAAASNDLEDRTSAFGLLRYAHQYHLAANLVHSAKKPDSYSPPAMMLVGHSIELSLKAFLRARGASLDDLTDIGHNLSRALTAARKRNLHRVVNLGSELEAAIVNLSDLHASGVFRYIRNGSMSVPPFVILSVVALDLTNRLRLFCLRRSFGREMAEKIVANRGNRF